MDIYTRLNLHGNCNILSYDLMTISYILSIYIYIQRWKNLTLFSNRISEYLFTYIHVRIHLNIEYIVLGGGNVKILNIHVLSGGLC